jgi:hypothetical protein
MTQAQATRIQHELLPISKGIPNRDPYLEYGIWILPFVRGGTILNVFLEDRNLMTEPIMRERNVTLARTSSGH